MTRTQLEDAPIIGTSVVFTHVNGVQRHDRIVAKETGLIQVEWQPWPAYLAALPHPTDDDREHCATLLDIPPGDSRLQVSTSFKLVE